MRELSPLVTVTEFSAYFGEYMYSQYTFCQLVTSSESKNVGFLTANVTGPNGATVIDVALIFLKLNENQTKIPTCWPENKKYYSCCPTVHQGWVF